MLTVYLFTGHYSQNMSPWNRSYLLPPVFHGGSAANAASTTSHCSRGARSRSCADTIQAWSSFHTSQQSQAAQRIRRGSSHTSDPTFPAMHCTALLERTKSDRTAQCGPGCVKNETDTISREIATLIDLVTIFVTLGLHLTCTQLDFLRPRGRTPATNLLCG